MYHSTTSMSAHREINANVHVCDRGLGLIHTKEKIWKIPVVCCHLNYNNRKIRCMHFLLPLTVVVSVSWPEVSSMFKS